MYSSGKGRDLNTLRIALLTYSTRPQGGVVHTLALAEALAARGHCVDVWSLSRGGDTGFFRPIDPAVSLRLVPFHDRTGEDVGARILRSVDTLGAAFDPVGYDVVHAQDCITANAVPDCIRTVHHLDTFDTPELIACHDRAIRRPYAHVCVSHALADDVERGWGIRPVVIPNGIDGGRFVAAAEDTAGRRSWAARLGRYVLAVGGIEPRKGSHDLIEAMAKVQRYRPTVRLVIAGGETLFDYREYRDRVLARAVRLDLDVRILGPVPHDRLPPLVAQAAAFAFPSVKEGFGMAAMEAMAAGVPVVMRDLPVLREVFADAATFAATPGDLAAGLLRAVERPDSEARWRARRLALAHTWDAAAAAHEEFYARVSRTCDPTDVAAAG